MKIIDIILFQNTKHKPGRKSGVTPRSVRTVCNARIPPRSAVPGAIFLETSKENNIPLLFFEMGILYIVFMRESKKRFVRASKTLLK